MKNRPVVMAVLGTRPEVIKLAPVIRWLEARSDRVTLRICVTAQHREMLDQMMAVFGLRGHVDLDVMKPGQSPMRVLREILAGLEPLLAKRRPKMLLVQGDTTTALAGALAGFHVKIPVAHVEAGLRSYDKKNPFPEEGNRVLVDHVSDLLFAPTRAAKLNLIRENVPAESIFVTGNTAVDAIQWSLKHCGRTEAVASAAPYVLVTIHRRESFGAPIQDIFRALVRLVEDRPDLRIVYPVHPNPNVRRWAYRMLRHPRIELREPASYMDFAALMKGSVLIMTDSGGIVEEAASVNKPVVILRNVTERPELVEAGGAVLAGTDTTKILRLTQRIFSDRELRERMSRVKNPYGDGKAAERIGRVILGRLT